MKEHLPARSEIHESRIREIADIIVEVVKDKVVFVILYGPFACGNWVRYRYSEAETVYDYASDYNFLVVTKNAKYTKNSAAFDFERKIKKKIDQSSQIKEVHRSHIILESISQVNDRLGKSQKFFSDIRNEGILLYDSAEFKLSDANADNEAQLEQVAKINYEHWFDGASGFLADYENAFKRDDYKKASFYLHQATENLYNCALLTLGGYKPKSHDLAELNQLCVFYSHDFLTTFPQANREQKECFMLLQQAYIEARYSKNFNIDKRQLEYLMTRVGELKDLVTKVCW